MNTVEALWRSRLVGATLWKHNGEPVKVRGDYAVGGAVKGLSLPVTIDKREFEDSVQSWLSSIPAQHKHVGIWESAGTIYVDASDIVSNRDNALAVARRRGEIAIFSFSTMSDIIVENEQVA